MTPVDRRALQAAIEWMRAESPERRKQIDDKLEREGFEAAGEFAAYAAQCAHLHLKPWQPPPCWATPSAAGRDDGVMGRKRAELLLLRMLAAGLSKYEPDPIDALERIESAA